MTAPRNKRVDDAGQRSRRGFATIVTGVCLLSVPLVFGGLVDDLVLPLVASAGFAVVSWFAVWLDTRGRHAVAKWLLYGITVPGTIALVWVLEDPSHAMWFGLMPLVSYLVAGPWSVLPTTALALVAIAALHEPWSDTGVTQGLMQHLLLMVFVVLYVWRTQDGMSRGGVQGGQVDSQSVEGPGFRRQRHLLAGLAHELNNPLTYASGAAEFVRESVTSDLGLEEDLSDLTHGLESLVDVTRVMQEIAGRPTKRAPSLVEPKPCVDMALRLLNRHVALVDLETELAAVPKIRVSLPELTALVVLVVAEAIECAEASSDGTVRVVLAVEEDVIQLSVAHGDRGGMYAPSVPPARRQVIDRLALSVGARLSWAPTDSGACAVLGFFGVH